jgi:hypothetical protein
MDFSADDYRLMARTFRLRAADETRDGEVERLMASARRYEALARDLGKHAGSDTLLGRAGAASLSWREMLGIS